MYQRSTSKKIIIDKFGTLERNRLTVGLWERLQQGIGVYKEHSYATEWLTSSTTSRIYPIKSKTTMAERKRAILSEAKNITQPVKKLKPNISNSIETNSNNVDWFDIQEKSTTIPKDDTKSVITIEDDTSVINEIYTQAYVIESSDSDSDVEIVLNSLDVFNDETGQERQSVASIRNKGVLLKNARVTNSRNIINSKISVARPSVERTNKNISNLAPMSSNNVNWEADMVIDLDLLDDDEIDKNVNFAPLDNLISEILDSRVENVEKTLKNTNVAKSSTKKKVGRPRKEIVEVRKDNANNLRKVRKNSKMNKIKPNIEELIEASIIDKRPDNIVDKNESIKNIVISSIVSGKEAEKLVDNSTNTKNDQLPKSQKLSLSKSHEEGASFKIDGQNFKILEVADSLDQFKSFLEKQKDPKLGKKTRKPPESNVTPQTLNPDQNIQKGKRGRPRKSNLTQPGIVNYTMPPQNFNSNVHSNSSQGNSFNLQEMVSKNLPNTTSPAVSKVPREADQIRVKTDVGNILAIVENETMTQSIVDDENENAMLDKLCFVSDIPNGGDESHNLNVAHGSLSKNKDNGSTATNSAITQKENLEKKAQVLTAVGLTTSKTARKHPPKSVLKKIENIHPEQINFDLTTNKSSSNLNTTISKLANILNKKLNNTEDTAQNSTSDENNLTPENQIEIKTNDDEDILELVENDKLIMSIVEDENENDELDSLCFPTNIVTEIETSDNANVEDEVDVVTIFNDTINQKASDSSDVNLIPPKRKRGRPFKTTTIPTPNITPNSTTPKKRRGRPPGSISKPKINTPPTPQTSQPVKRRGRPPGSLGKKSKPPCPEFLTATENSYRYSLRDTTKENSIMSYANLVNEIVENFPFQNLFTEDDQLQIRSHIDKMFAKIKVENESDDAIIQDNEISADGNIFNQDYSDETPPSLPILSDKSQISNPLDSTYSASPLLVLNHSSETLSPNNLQDVMPDTKPQIVLKEFPKSLNCDLSESEKTPPIPDQEVVANNSNAVIDQPSRFPHLHQLLLSEQPPILNNSKSPPSKSSDSNEIPIEENLPNSESVDSVSSKSDAVPVLIEQFSNINASKSNVNEEIAQADEQPRDSPSIDTYTSLTSHGNDVLASNENEEIAEEKRPEISSVIAELDKLKASDIYKISSTLTENEELSGNMTNKSSKIAPTLDETYLTFNDQNISEDSMSSIRSASPIDNLSDDAFIENNLASSPINSVNQQQADINVKRTENEAILPKNVPVTSLSLSEINLFASHENQASPNVIISEPDPLAIENEENHDLSPISDPLAIENEENHDLSPISDPLPTKFPSSKPEESLGKYSVSIEPIYSDASTTPHGNKLEEFSILRESSTKNILNPSESSKSFSTKKVLRKCRNSLEFCAYCRNYYDRSNHRIHQELKCQVRFLPKKRSKCKKDSDKNAISNQSILLSPKGYKLFFCIYCKNSFKDLYRHLSTKHKDEAEIQDVLVHKIGSTERIRLLNRLKNRGISVFNRNPKYNNGKIILPPQKQKLFNCWYCDQYVGRKCLLKHQKRCLHSQNLKYLHPKTDKILKEKILDSMINDEITNVLRTDELLVLLGNFFVHKYPVTRYKYVRYSMRNTGRFFLCIKSLDPNINEFSALYNPKYCDLMIRGIQKTAKFEPVSQSYQNADLVIKLTEIIKRCGKMYSGICAKTHDFNKEEMTKMFLKEFQAKLHKTLEIEDKINKSTIPFEDRKLLFTKTEEDVKHFSKTLTEKFTLKEWIELSKASLMYLRLINGNICENPQSLLLTDYENKTDLAPSENILRYHNLTKLRLTENNYFSLKMQEFNVSLLLTQEFCDAIDVLIKNRQNAQVSEHNLYLFASPLNIDSFYTMKEARESILTKYSKFKRPTNLKNDKKDNRLSQKTKLSKSKPKTSKSRCKQYEKFKNKMLALKGVLSENFTCEKWIFLSAFTLDFIKFLNDKTNKDILNFIFLVDIDYVKCQIDADKEEISNCTMYNLTSHAYPDDFFKIKLKNTDITVILNSQIRETLDLLIRQRNLANIDANNPFVFASNYGEHIGYHTDNLKFNSSNLDEMLNVRSSLIDELIHGEFVSNDNLDTTKLFYYVQIQITHLASVLEANFTKDSWLNLQKHLLIYLHLLNTKIPAEPEDLLISDCQKTLKLEDNQEQNEYHSLTALDDYPLNYRLVPTEEESAYFLISVTVCNAMLLMLQYRIHAGVDQSNPYVFGSGNSQESTLEVKETMKEIMVNCGLNSCKYLKAKIVRNSIKLVEEVVSCYSGFSEEEDDSSSKKDTTGQISRRRWSKKEVRVVRRELGHFLQNNDDRKLPTLPDCEQVISANPILRGRSAEQLKAWVNNQLHKMTKEETSAAESSPQSERIVRLRWTDVEQEIVKKCLGKYLTTRTLPSASQCREIIKAYPELSTRSATLLRAWINNQNRKKTVFH